MRERSVRATGRPIYGRAQPLVRPRRGRGVKRPRFTLLQIRLFIIAVVIVAVGWGIGQLFALQMITVVAPARSVEIKNESKKIIEGNWRWGNLVLFDGDGFVTKLQQTDPALRNVSVRRKWFHTIIVTAALKQPSLGWSTGNQAYVLDRDGTVIGATNAVAPLPVVFDGSNIALQVGQKVVSTHFVEFASAIVPALNAVGISVTRLDIKDTTLDLSAQTNKGYSLLFDTGRTVPEAIADLQAVQRLLVIQKRTPLEYIDLRIAGKAYYK